MKGEECRYEEAARVLPGRLREQALAQPPEVRQRAEHYRPQLEAYSRALERVLEKKVVRRALYFLAAGETMEI